MINTIQSARDRLHNGETSSRNLIEEAITLACASEGEGGRVFTKLHLAQARKIAEALDSLRAAGIDLSPICGLPVSIKDLFDAEGEVTSAGSTVLRNSPPASADAAIVGRLKRAGALIVGRTNMTEFAYSGVGLNPHYGTPANPFDRDHRRIPGGSSSGAAVSVTDGMALAAVASDTGGSVRIPAALCGVTGFKPTQSRIPLHGVFPLSPTLDSVGILAQTVACCAAVDAVVADDAAWPLQPVDLRLKRLAVPDDYFFDEMDAHVAKTLESTLSKLSIGGARITDVQVPELAEVNAINANGGFAAAEAYAYHRELGTEFEAYDPLVRERIIQGQAITASEYLDIVKARALLIRTFNRVHADLDIILCPTVPIVAPEISEVQESKEEYHRVNRLLLRNPSVVNLLDRCALSIPCHTKGDAPVGLMLIGRRHEDLSLLSTGAVIEQILDSRRGDRMELAD